MCHSFSSQFANLGVSCYINSKHYRIFHVISTELPSSLRNISKVIWFYLGTSSIISKLLEVIYSNIDSSDPLSELPPTMFIYDGLCFQGSSLLPFLSYEPPLTNFSDFEIEALSLRKLQIIFLNWHRGFSTCLDHPSVFYFC